MFARESEMTMPAIDWMKSIGLSVKSEFVSPWGICDLAGVAMNADKVEHRLRLKQTQPLGSTRLASLLLEIPDIESKKFTTLRRLVKKDVVFPIEGQIKNDIDRLIADRFILKTGCRLQKLNGWTPLQDRLVAVELKLSRIDEALRQARGNLGFATQSYAGFPPEIAEKIANKFSRWSQFFDVGVGLLSVTPNGCEVLVESNPATTPANLALQMYCVEKFWRTRSKDTSSSTAPQ